MRAAGYLYNQDQFQDPDASSTWGGPVASFASQPSAPGPFLSALQLDARDVLGLQAPGFGFGAPPPAAVIPPPAPVLPSVALDGESVGAWTEYLTTHLHPRSSVELSGHQRQVGFDVYAHGSEYMGDSQQREDIMDAVRWFLEECDRLQGIQCMIDVDSGFAGMAAAVLAELRDEVASAPFLQFGLSPQRHSHTYAGTPSTAELAGQSVGNVGTHSRSSRHRRRLNEAMSLAELSALRGSTYVPLSAEHYRPDMFPGLAVKPHLPYHTSAIMAAAIDTATMLFRGGGNNTAALAATAATAATSPAAAASLAASRCRSMRDMITCLRPRRSLSVSSLSFSLPLLPLASSLDRLHSHLQSLDAPHSHTASPTALCPLSLAGHLPPRPSERLFSHLAVVRGFNGCQPGAAARAAATSDVRVAPVRAEGDHGHGAATAAATAAAAAADGDQGDGEEGGGGYSSVVDTVQEAVFQFLSPAPCPATHRLLRTCAAPLYIPSAFPDFFTDGQQDSDDEWAELAGARQVGAGVEETKQALASAAAAPFTALTSTAGSFSASGMYSPAPRAPRPPASAFDAPTPPAAADAQASKAGSGSSSRLHRTRVSALAYLETSSALAPLLGAHAASLPGGGSLRRVPVFHQYAAAGLDADDVDEMSARLCALRDDYAE